MERWRDWRIMSSGGPGRGAYPAGELMTALDFRPRGVRRGEGAPGGVAGGLANRFPNSRYSPRTSKLLCRPNRLNWAAWEPHPMPVVSAPPRRPLLRVIAARDRDLTVAGEMPTLRVQMARGSRWTAR